MLLILLPLIVVTIKKGAFGSPSTKVANFTNRAIDQMSWVFANCLGDWGSIPGRVIPKTQKMVLDAILFNTQHYRVRTKGKVEQGTSSLV